MARLNFAIWCCQHTTEFDDRPDQTLMDGAANGSSEPKLTDAA